MRFLVPAFLGNSVGGVALVGALAHAQHAPE
jgi:formate/nitrite transporter FocA (FNT family)